MPALFTATLILCCAYAPKDALPLGVLVAVYLSACCISATRDSVGGSWVRAPILPVAYAAMHLGYGSGFLFGLVRFWNRWGSRGGSMPSPPIAGGSGAE